AWVVAERVALLALVDVAVAAVRLDLGRPVVVIAAVVDAAPGASTATGTLRRRVAGDREDEGRDDEEPGRGAEKGHARRASRVPRAAARLSRRARQVRTAASSARRGPTHPTWRPHGPRRSAHVLAAVWLDAVGAQVEDPDAVAGRVVPDQDLRLRPAEEASDP